jgi:ATPase subunit of ABC transporter with duplicated ATPase domains
MITGQLKPDSGEVNIGHTVKVAYVDQSREKLEGDKNVWQEVSGGSDIITIGKVEIQSRAYIGRFNFKGSDQQKLVGTLSAASAAACTWPRPCCRAATCCCSTNPSNDLDIETLRALETRCSSSPAASW